jgi:hypothetical protein
LSPLQQNYHGEYGPDPRRKGSMPALAAITLRRALSGAAITCLACLFLLLKANPAPAQTPEEQLKAAMLSHFSLFVEWPAEALPDAASPFVFCLLGADSLRPWLQKKLEDLRLNTHPVEVRHLANPDQAPECHLLYIDRAEEPRLGRVLDLLRQSSVLTVSDIDGFCQQGGMVALLLEGGRMDFDLNAEAAEAAGLKIDSALKRIARTVNCGKGP